VTTTVKSAKPAHEPDGRRRRSQDSRARIVAAMLELMHEGALAPGAEQVADRAQVGLRTVFRHFNDMESLYREMAYVIEAELRKVAGRPFKAPPGPGRIVELVERRTPAYEQIAPVRRAADAQRHGSPFLAAQHARLAAESREIVKRELPSELAADPSKLEMLDLLLSYEAWDRLRRDQGLSARRAREVLEAGVRRVLEG
jgi:AcrR family transcriptional regulator